MKKTLLILLVLGVIFVGCSLEPNLYGSLTINDSPAGYSFFAFVYSSNTMPSNYSEYSSMTTSSIAAGSGSSPVKLAWPGGTSSGNYLVKVSSGSTTKITVTSFNKDGKATVNWNTMADEPSRN
jgi:hypothetical protein